ncbi:TIGR03088 family PEP-CTERM/XrtA system glycosyltransferase [Ectothiorhodospira marina]|uniref:TIGR03088 family PEP-CTERM/XrtA system glycosyltransferase n=1 Tax=Ectothiorhodospira marina TaxID=1396821 RepID=UPI000B7FADB3|nr:TIGR03088 family PEP-CTERM/XrtA system glycosyltransferase [Ectothiorhodospira marina]
MAHLIYRLDVGGLENILLELIQGLPSDRYRHVVVCLDDFNPDFLHRLPPDTAIHALHKPPGLGLTTGYRFWRLMRRLRPDILHSCNMAALEYQPLAWLAGVPVRIHAEHGRDMGDLDGSNVKLQRLRRLLSPFVHRHLAVSSDLLEYLHRIGIPGGRAALLYNGVSTQRFKPRSPADAPLMPPGFDTSQGTLVIGTVGRMQPVKDQVSLVRAFAQLRSLRPEMFERLRLVLVGDGPERDAIAREVEHLDVSDQVWLTGARDDTPILLAGMDIFVLPSLAEGTPVTVLEAMASGLPVVASRVGGLPELVVEGETGSLVPPSSPAALAKVLVHYLDDPARIRREGQAARKRVETAFSLSAMIHRYDELYAGLLCRVR